MSDLISKSALLESLMHCDGLGRKSFDAVLQTINEQPTADAVPVVHGEWIRQHKEKIWGKSTEIVCSICGEKSWLEYDFCPRCGADMRKPELVVPMDMLEKILEEETHGRNNSTGNN